MIHSVIPAARLSPVPEALVMDAARCWREARDGGHPVQPALHAMLAPAGYAMLGPVLDSQMRPATVTGVEPLSAGFRLIDLAGDALRGVAWTPGQKIQVMMGGLFTARTYTPMEWNPERGSTRILAWSHGSGPGSDWAINLAKGDACQLFGPRRSLDVAGMAGPLVLFGDESSFGLAVALMGASDRVRPPHLLFEATSAEECRPVLEGLGSVRQRLSNAARTMAICPISRAGSASSRGAIPVSS